MPNNAVLMESRIKDISLAEYGRKEVNLAEAEMPGLMACREEYAEAQPLKGAKISGALHCTVQTAVLVETLRLLGAELRWCGCNIFSTQDEAAAALVASGACTLFAWKGQTLDEYWWCMLQAFSWPNSDGPDILLDDGGDATLFLHEGYDAEIEYEATGKLPDYENCSAPGLRAIRKLVAEQLLINPTKWRAMIKNIIGVSEQTTTGVHRLLVMAKRGKLLFPAINVNDSVTKSKFDNVYGCRHSLPDGIMRATDIMIGGKKVVICGYGDVGKGSAASMTGCGARVFITEIDPVCALQALMEGYEVVRLESIVHVADIFVTATGNCNVIMLEHMLKMKNNAIVCNIGHFDTEIDWQGVVNYGKVQRLTIKSQVDRFYFPETDHGVIILAEGRLVNLGCATGHPSFVMSCSFTNQVLAQLELWISRSTRKYNKTVYILPKELDEKVALLHVRALGGELTELTQEQSEYLSIPINGPYKPITYRY